MYPAARYAILNTEEEKPETYGLPFIVKNCYINSRSLVRVVGGYFLFPRDRVTQSYESDNEDTDLD